MKPIVVLCAAALAAVLITKHAKAQSAPKPAAAPAAASKAVPARCFRLPLSDVAFGKENAIQAARDKLEEYAAIEAKTRKWPAGPLVKSNETIGDCSVYLDFGPLIGTEYRCLVTATYCQK